MPLLGSDATSADPQGRRQDFAKIHALDELARLAAGARFTGLRVPAGVYALPDTEGHLRPALRDALAAEALARLGEGPFIVRAALAGEDEAGQSLAGAGLSVPNVRGAASLARAIEEVVEHGLALRLGPAGARVDCALIVQRYVAPALIGVLAQTPEGSSHLELHRSGAAEHEPSSPLLDPALGQALDQGRSPDWAGPLSAWQHRRADEFRTLVPRLAERFAHPHGIDLELVVDQKEDQLWCVQLRPLTRPLFEGWPEFRAALVAQGDDAWRRGDWVLDAQHNPEPLSPAHIWLLDALRAARPRRAGDPTAFAGWLYARRLPSQLAAVTAPGPGEAAQPGEDKDKLSAAACLRELFETWLPQAQARAEAVAARAARAGSDPREIEACLDQAFEAFVEMIDLYLGRIVPARASVSDRSHSSAQPLSTRMKAEHLQVLLARWDLASPSLAELGLVGDARPNLELPTDEASAATLLEECDDLLFAWGLHGLREVYRSANRALGWPAGLAFGLRGPALASALHAPDESHRTLAQVALERQAGQAQLRPPLRLLNGEAVATAWDFARTRRHARAAFAFGPPCAGPLCVRADLEALLHAPPPPHALLVMPTLTAAAAIAIAGMRLAGVVTEFGGRLSHGVLVARELGLSALIGLPGCTELADGTPASLDPARGRIVMTEFAPDDRARI